MIITDRLGVDFIITDEASTATRDWAHEIARREVIHAGENCGAFIRPESVRFFDRTGPADSAQCLTRWRARWYPNPRDGVLLVEGPMDGTVVAWPCDDPPPTIVLPLQPNFSIGNGGPMQDVYPSTVCYRLYGIDSAQDRWAYKVQS